MTLIKRTGYDCKVLADSIGPSGVRLTTLVATFPRFILAELNTHRMFSRNSASSRAIPVKKQIQRVEEHGFVPETFPANQRGMQGGEPIPDENLAREVWETSMGEAVEAARELATLKVHKQHTNRILEPYMWHTTIVTATEWDNFLALRCHPDAQPEIQRLAGMIRDNLQASTPKTLQGGEWHLPLVRPNEPLDGYSPELISAGRCARVSYLTHDGTRDLEADHTLALRLRQSGHMSPFEHQARAWTEAEWKTLQEAQEAAYRAVSWNLGGFVGKEVVSGMVFSGNLRGWRQYRKMLPKEDCFQQTP